LANLEPKNLSGVEVIFALLSDQTALLTMAMLIRMLVKWKS